MATKYGSSASGTGDGAWDTLGNWWSDAIGGTPALSTPQPGDDVVTDGTFVTGPAIAVALNSFDDSISAGSDNLNTTNISVVTSLNVTSCVWITDLPATVNATFTSSLAELQGNVNGASVSFLSGAAFAGAQSSGNMTFDSSSNYGNIAGGTASFTDFSVNYGTISGSVATFSGQSVTNNAITNSTVSFSSGGIANASLVQCKVSFDGDSIYDSVTGGWAFSQLTECVLSLDGGSTWFIAQALLPAASAVRAPNKTYNASGDAVKGSLIVPVRGLHGWII